MPEEKNELEQLFENELVQVIDSSLAVLVTLSELPPESISYDEERSDIDTVKRNTYRIIFAAQRKLLKTIKTGKDAE